MSNHISLYNHDDAIFTTKTNNEIMLKFLLNIHIKIHLIICPETPKCDLVMYAGDLNIENTLTQTTRIITYLPFTYFNQEVNSI